MFRKVPSNMKKGIIVFLSLGITVLLFLYFPFGPNLGYLKYVMPMVQEQLGQVIPIVLIILFYSMFVLVFYWVMLPFVARIVWLINPSEGSCIVHIDKKEPFVVSLTDIHFEKGKVIINHQGNTIKLQKYSLKESHYNNFKNSISSVQNNNSKSDIISFLGYMPQLDDKIRILISLLITVLIFGIVGYYYEMYLINSYKNILSILFNFRGIILMFLIRIPLIFLFLVLLLMTIFYTINFNSKIYVKFKKKSIIIICNERRIQIIKQDIQKSIFFASCSNHRIKKLLIKLNNNKSYVITSNLVNNDFNQFLDTYCSYNNIKEEDLICKRAFVDHYLIKKIYYHE